MHIGRYIASFHRNLLLPTSHCKSASCSAETLVYLYQFARRPITGDRAVPRRDRITRQPVGRVRSGIRRQSVVLRTLISSYMRVLCTVHS